MKKSAFMGGALPKARLAVAVIAVATSCSGRPRDPVEVEVKSKRIEIAGLDARALKIDTNGYLGEICISNDVHSFGCYLNGVKDVPFQLDPGDYYLHSGLSEDYVESEHGRLGVIKVHGAQATVDSTHFDPVAGDTSTIRARTVQIQVNPNGHPLSLETTAWKRGKATMASAGDASGPPAYSAGVVTSVLDRQGAAGLL